jgi:UPF0755 protein
MKRIISLFFLIIIVIGGLLAWMVIGSGTAFNEKNKYFTIADGKTNEASVLQVLKKRYIVKNTWVFSVVASQMNLWNKIKPGRYEIKRGESMVTIIGILKNNHQAEINLVINKIRVKEDLAKLISKNFVSDSTEVMNFLNSPDSLKPYQIDTSDVFTMIIPDTYKFYWNTSLRKIFNRLHDASVGFWSVNQRVEKANKLGFTPTQAYILASIIEEETNKDDDRAKIASVYINRLTKSMPLQACPTIKYAMKDFSLTRIYEKYLTNPSLYNTYHHKGLPPGPICTPSPKTIDIVLNAPKTDYLYFVAKSDFSGYSHFSTTFAEHDKYAKEYQKALDIYMAKKQQLQEEPSQ